MLRKIKTLALSACAGLAVLGLPAQAVPLIIFDETNGKCLLNGANEFNYIDVCGNGAVLLISRSSGGVGGGGPGPCDGPIVPFP